MKVEQPHGGIQKGTVMESSNLTKKAPLISYIVLFIFVLCVYLNYLVALFRNNFGISKKMYYYVSCYLFEILLILACLCFFYEYYYVEVSNEFLLQETNKIAPQNRKMSRIELTDQRQSFLDNNNNNDDSLKRKKSTWLEGNISRNEKRTCVETLFAIGSNILSTPWTRFSIIVSGNVLYYIVIFIVFISNKKHKQVEYVYCGLLVIKLFSDVLPAICLYVYSNAKIVYEPIADNPKFNLAKYLKAKHRKRKKQKEKEKQNGKNAALLSDAASTNSDVVSVLTPHTKTLAAISSILNNHPIQFWIICVCLSKLAIYIGSPLLRLDNIDNDISNDLSMIIEQFNGNSVIGEATFVWTIIILRQFNAMIDIFTIVLALEVYSGHYEAGPMENLQYIINPFIVVIYAVVISIDINFTLTCDLRSTYYMWIVQLMWCVPYLVIILFLLFVLLPWLIKLRAKAQQEILNFHAYKRQVQKTPMVIIEGVVILVFNMSLLVSMFLYYFVNNQNMWQECQFNNDKGETNFKWFIFARKILLFCFDGVILAMAYSLRVIAHGEKAMEYFSKPHKCKYVFGFRLICFLAIYNIFFEISFQIFRYGALYKLVSNDDNENRISIDNWGFASSFCSIYFNAID